VSPHGRPTKTASQRPQPVRRHLASATSAIYDRANLLPTLSEAKAQSLNNCATRRRNGGYVSCQAYVVAALPKAAHPGALAGIRGIYKPEDTDKAEVAISPTLMVLRMVHLGVRTDLKRRWSFR